MSQWDQCRREARLAGAACGVLCDLAAAASEAQRQTALAEAGAAAAIVRGLALVAAHQSGELSGVLQLLRQAAAALERLVDPVIAAQLAAISAASE